MARLGRRQPFKPHIQRFNYFVTAHVAVIPSIVSLSLTAFAPTLSLSVIPSTASFTLTTFAPKANLAVIPSTAILTLGSVVVSGAGTSAANGTYTRRGTFDNHPYFNLVGQPDSTTQSAIVWATGNYLLKDASGGDLYVQSSGSPQPWDDPFGWDVVDGIAPEPIVTEQIGFLPTVLNPTVAIPATASLVLTTFAPVLSTAVIPSTASLTIAKFAPVLATAVIPSTASLVLATFAPTAGSGVTAAPGSASLSLATFAPSVSATANVTAIPSTLTLTVTKFAPSLAIAVIPSAATLTLTKFAPSANATNNVSVIPGTLAITTTTFAPTISAAGNFNVTPGTLALVLNTFIPTLRVFTATGSIYRTVVVEAQSRIINAERDGILIVESETRAIAA